jgi:glyceraldehyde 3-phosphate dehydrogenase
VATNDLLAADHLAYLFSYDTVHRKCRNEVSSREGVLKVDSQLVRVLNVKEPDHLPWKDLGIDYVVESSGHFTTMDKARAHIRAGARRVVITAPAGGEGVPTYVMGVNHVQYNPAQDRVVSNASCTTNCLAPLCSVLDRRFGIEEGLMTTIHALTASQPVVDGSSHKDWRGGRAATCNIIPAATGAAEAVTLCLPKLRGKITGMAFRVPVLDVSVVDLTVRLTKKTSYPDVVAAVQEASSQELRGIMHVVNAPLVSSDFIGSSYSSILDVQAGIELNPYFYKLIAWYDNEWGYAHRVVDLLKFMASKEGTER